MIEEGGLRPTWQSQGVHRSFWGGQGGVPETKKELSVAWGIGKGWAAGREKKIVLNEKEIVQGEKR